MTRKLIAITLLCCTILLAEYQAFLVKGTIKVPEEGRIKSTSINGVLVTASCYPCGAFFGTNYPSKLYVRTSDNRKVVQVYPAAVRGGLYRRAPMWIMENVYDPQHPTDTQLKYMRQNTRGWIHVEAPLELRGHTYELNLVASGTASIKYRNGEVQPYLKSLSGSVQGANKDSLITIDPVNLYDPELTYVTGTCAFYYSRTYTELIRGTSDWNIIDKLILRRLGS